MTVGELQAQLAQYSLQHGPGLQVHLEVLNEAAATVERYGVQVETAITKPVYGSSVVTLVLRPVGAPVRVQG